MRFQKRTHFLIKSSRKYFLYVAKTIYYITIRKQTSITGRVRGVLFRNITTFNLNKRNINQYTLFSNKIYLRKEKRINFNICLTIILLIIIVFQMIKIKKTTLPKLSQSLAQRKKSYQANCQNEKPPAFNTKGYFDPNEPYDQEYLQLKEKVFQKYRSRQAEYVMLDIKNINRAAFIQRGCQLAPKQNNQSLEDSFTMGKSRQILLKHYLMRKQRRENLDSQKYHLDTPKINGDILQSRITANSKSFCRSRVSSNSQFKSQSQY